jgi:hypothetical protein
LERDPAELRRSVLSFLGADPREPSDRLSAEYTQAGWKKLPMIDKVRFAPAQFFKKELKAALQNWRPSERMAGAIWFFITDLFLGAS